MGTAPSYRSNVKTRPAAEKDRQVSGQSCDVCGPLLLGEEPVRLSGEAGDIQVCSECVRRLAEKAA